MESFYEEKTNKAKIELKYKTEARIARKSNKREFLQSK